jgi:phosphatidate cytidylyltransferase
VPAACISFGLFTGYFMARYTSLDAVYELFCKYLFGMVYVGMFGAHLVLMRLAPDGAQWLILASAITACSDTGAYFIGKRFGSRLLCPNISPKKTVEGAIGGLVAGSIAALVCGMLLLETSLVFIFLVSIVLIIVGVAGDLTESIIKRGTGTKDSGTLLAGHGGVLDRIDSLLLVVPTLYYVIHLLGLE